MLFSNLLTPLKKTSVSPNLNNHANSVYARGEIWGIRHGLLWREAKPHGEFSFYADAPYWKKSATNFNNEVNFIYWNVCDWFEITSVNFDKVPQDICCELVLIWINWMETCRNVSCIKLSIKFIYLHLHVRIFIAHQLTYAKTNLFFCYRERW